MVTGIICEYNPFHSGHKKQIDIIKAKHSDDGIVCLMSGNFVQRGAPAIFDKITRAKAAILCGADLVLELPINISLASAEGFASGGVSILSDFCDRLCFGAENADENALMELAQVLLTKEFSAKLREKLKVGISFPAARQAALEALNANSTLITTPNNILAVEYCKAILAQNSTLCPMPILREGNYHSLAADSNNPSATFLRQQIYQEKNWKEYVPKQAAEVFRDAVTHQISYGERAILYRLRTMTDDDFEALPYGSEGLWRRLMHAARKEKNLEDIINATKSKRYTRSRIDRMIIAAYLGISAEFMKTPAPYIRVLALNQRGRKIIKDARSNGTFINIGEQTTSAYQNFEDRCGTLYGLFSSSAADQPNIEQEYRIFNDSTINVEVRR